MILLSRKSHANGSAATLLYNTYFACEEMNHASPEYRSVSENKVEAAAKQPHKEPILCCLQITFGQRLSQDSRQAFAESLSRKQQRLAGNGRLEGHGQDVLVV